MPATIRQALSAIQGRLRASLSPGYGYTGFLISWMAGGNPLGIIAAAFVLAVITAGGDILQMTQALPGSVANHHHLHARTAA